MEKSVESKKSSNSSQQPKQRKVDKPWLSAEEHEEDEVTRRKNQLLRQIRQKARQLTRDTKPPLVKHHWTISPAPKKDDLNLTAPPSTKYSPNIDSSSKMHRSQGCTIKPLQQHFSRKKKRKAAEGDNDGHSQSRRRSPHSEAYLSLDDVERRRKRSPSPSDNDDDDVESEDPRLTDPRFHPEIKECTFKPSFDPSFLLKKPEKKKAISTGRESPSLESGCLISKTKRKFETFERGTPPPGSYPEAEPKIGAKCKGGRLSMLPRFQQPKSITPGPGEYTPSVGGGASSNVKGTSFAPPVSGGSASTPTPTLNRGLINEKNAAKVPGPGSYTMNSVFDNHAQDISMVSAGFFASRVQFDRNIYDPQLMQDIHFVRSTAQDIARIKLMNSLQ